MRVFKTVLNGKGLLAASIAMLSTSALAETAGRVSFVSGAVTASLPDGSSRQLQKGDVINGGDRISTRAGRLQIRFSDGGFVSLQPNTVFGVDEYLYSNRKPEETSLFFSLLQGGMRTITGAIGKVNKQSYKVRTPVATIGIRGTGYRATMTPHGLVVSVGSGFVHVVNNQGEVTGGAGQNISVPDAGSPPALGNEQADLQASGVNGDQDQGDENSQDHGTGNTAAVGNVQNANGDYLFLFTTIAPDAAGYSLAYANPGNSVAPGSSGFMGGYYAAGADSSLTNTYDSQGLVSAASNPNGQNLARNAAIATDTGSSGSLNWGRWTKGDISINGSATTLGANDSLHYVTGPMTPASAFLAFKPGASATYSLSGGTTATGNDGSTGTLGGNSKIMVSFGATPTVAIDLDVAMKNSSGASLGNYTLSTLTPVSNLAVDYANTSATGTASFAATGISAGGTACASAGACSGNISGFFSGQQAQQIGLGYHISDLGRVVDGAAAFTRGAITAPIP
ncbi:MAG: FecR family protein [bacterium]|nr:FecR family protein [bacterium]